jgi:hypothetical protein
MILGYRTRAEHRLGALRHGTASVANQMQIRRFFALVPHQATFAPVLDALVDVRCAAS